LGNKKKSTIKDIANVLGITPSAVSKALNNNPRISEKTKIAVQQVAKNLNYQPNHLASALRKGKSNLVGVIIPRANSNFFSSVVEKMEEVLNSHGYNVIMTQSNESYEKECRNIDALLYTQVDGVIASMANETVELEYYQKIKSKGIPLILFDRGENDLEVDYVGIDDYMTSQMVVKHLVEQGCKRIAHIAGFQHSRIYKNRIRGYKDALVEFDLPISKDLIIESNLGIDDGRRSMKKLLELPIRPDAIYAAGDWAALGALQVLKEVGIKVPEEMALVGFSNEPFTSFVSPPISTINQHNSEIGRITAETFLDRMENPSKEVTLNKIILEAELIIRQSSKNK
jgi:LacI family transcriptional regulator|tara:strand:+ start:306 stop:1331 length:1026 start_codon:yes stop_codon:yes gene_type:complete